jgi:hypothetical protein
MTRIFLLSPASCGGERARLVLRPEARFDLASRLRTREGAALGEVFAFLSGLYFRGKLTYAREFARPPAGVPGVLVITPSSGLVAPEQPVRHGHLVRWAGVSVDPAEARYIRPLARDLRRLAADLGDETEVVLLGSIATAKYLEPLQRACDERLRVPREFVSRGDMSRGGLLLRHARSGVELEYAHPSELPRSVPRPPRLVPVRGILRDAMPPRP